MHPSSVKSFFWLLQLGLLVAHSRTCQRYERILCALAILPRAEAIYVLLSNQNSCSNALPMLLPLHIRGGSLSRGGRTFGCRSLLLFKPRNFTIPPKTSTALRNDHWLSTQADMYVGWKVAIAWCVHWDRSPVVVNTSPSQMLFQHGCSFLTDVWTSLSV